MEQTTLYYRQSSSDKIYQASIEPQDGGFVVRFAYGRRGTTLQTGTKTQTPVTNDEAKRIYDKLLAEKTAKGYTPGADGTPYQHTDKAQQATGVLPQLLNAIDADEAARLIADPNWVLQEKFDGRRTLIRKADDRIDGINRNGLVVALPETVAQAAAELPGTFIFDGECVSDEFVAFDLLELSGGDYRGFPYHVRLRTLMQLVPDAGALRSAETAEDEAHKAEMLDRLRELKKEGAVFKKAAGVYLPGRPASGGDALKLKFCETASFVVGKVNAKRSVTLLLFSGDKIKPAGNVTIPPNHQIPQAGQIVECRYLYAFAESGSIYQPVYLGVREDIRAEDCTTTQLKFKAESTEQAV
ncbi:MAG: bifunctional non-ous end joining protein LigD [Chthoniobacter sp.]|jgi:bifunctional non-homologous end joining protein LigD|nr:bifunctional non-ous end joining protein LigD [Chthoniobacter sp.]